MSCKKDILFLYLCSMIIIMHCNAKLDKEFIIILTLLIINPIFLFRIE